MTKIMISSEIDKPIDKWSNKDFVIYFSNKLAETTGTPLKIEGPAWIGFMSRIKGFRSKLVISNTQYKEFIDSIFSKFFDRGYVPVFGSIVSERVYFVIQKLNSLIIAVSAEEFEQLRNQLFNNITLFKKLQ
jgi:hypothetical protein